MLVFDKKKWEKDRREILYWKYENESLHIDLLETYPIYRVQYLMI